MTTCALRRLSCVFVIAVALLAATHEAKAADTTITYTFPSSDTSGVTAQASDGIGGCLVGCASFRVAAMTPLPARRQSVLQFAAPSGTTIVSSTIGLRYRTKSLAISVHLQNRLNGRWIDGVRLRSASVVNRTVSAGGGTAIGVALATDAAVVARSVRSVAENTLAVDSVQLVVRDLSVPSVVWSGGDPSTGRWQRGIICGAFAAQDVGLGIDHVDFAIGSTSASAVAPPGSRTQPRPSSFSGTLCVDSAQLVDGVYGTVLSAVDSGEAGNRSSLVTGLVRVDNTAPDVQFIAPTDSEARLPTLKFLIDDRASGVATLSGTLDGLPIDLKLAGGSATATPPQALSDGLHRVSWTVSDSAGNITQDAATFGISDVTPPAIEQVTPVGLTTASVPIGARLTDTGSGLAVDAIRLAVDGNDVTGLVEVTNGTLLYQPQRGWADGDHSARLIVVDRSGNRTVRSWTFQLPVAPPPPAPAPAITPLPIDVGGSVAPATSAGDSSVRGELVLSASPKLSTQGRRTIVRVEAMRGEQPAAGLRLQVQWRQGSGLPNVIADARGVAVISIASGTSGTLVITAEGSQISVVVKPTSTILLQATQHSVLHGELVQLHGSVRGSSMSTVWLEAKVGTRWRMVSVVPVETTGRYATPVRLPSRGTYLVRMRLGVTTSESLRLVAR